MVTAFVRSRFREVGRVAQFLKRPVLMLLGAWTVLIAAGLIYGAVTGHGVQKSVAYALFIGGAVIVVFAGLSGGGARSQQWSTHMSGRYEPADMPFGAVVIGALVIGLGVAVLKL